jgi:hypothetical protein
MPHSVNYIFQRINWTKPNLCRFHSIVRSSTFGLLKLNITSALRLLFFSPIPTIKDSPKIILLSCFRRDLLQDFDKIIDHLSPDYKKIIIKPYQKISIQFLSYGEVIYAWRQSESIFKYISLPKVKSIFARFWLFLSILEGIKLINILEKKQIKVERVVALMDMQFYENILVQFYKLSGARTYAYQHGFYRDTGNEITLTNCNPVNYLASVCDTVLAWGDASKSILEKYINGRVVSTGKPTLLINDLGNGSVPVSTDSPLHFVAVLDSILQRERNLKIMGSLSQSLQNNEVLSYIPHPDDDFDYTKFRATKITHDQMNRNKHTIVANNSSAILQYGRAGYRVLLLEDSDFIKFAPAKILETLSRVKKDAMTFIDIKAESSVFWNLYIVNYGDSCLSAMKSVINNENHVV